MLALLRPSNLLPDDSGSRNTNCMSDYRELQHGFDIFKSFFLDAAKRKAFVDAFVACAPGAADDAFAAFNNWWQDLRLNTYIACVPEHQDSEDVHGRLSMWRAFGGTGTGVGIVLRFPCVPISAVALALNFSPVARPSRITRKSYGPRVPNRTMVAKFDHRSALLVSELTGFVAKKR
jgi:hypothetical protein